MGGKDDKEENNPLPAALFNAGFDVWLGNSRGTPYSTPASPTAEFWDYTASDLSLDVKAFVTKILEETGKE